MNFANEMKFTVRSKTARVLWSRLNIKQFNNSYAWAKLVM